MASLRSAARLTKNARSLLSRVAAYELPGAAGTAARTLPAALRTFSAAAEPAKAPIIENVSVWRRGRGMHRIVGWGGAAAAAAAACSTPSARPSRLCSSHCCPWPLATPAGHVLLPVRADQERHRLHHRR